MKEYLCKINWTVMVTAKNEEEAKQEAWDIFDGTMNADMQVEEK